MLFILIAGNKGLMFMIVSTVTSRGCRFSQCSRASMGVNRVSLKVRESPHRGYLYMMTLRPCCAFARSLGGCLPINCQQRGVSVSHRSRSAGDCPACRGSPSPPTSSAVNILIAEKLIEGKGYAQVEGQKQNIHVLLFVPLSGVSSATLRSQGTFR